jgi:chemotaxis protein methyltransferase CheR
MAVNSAYNISQMMSDAEFRLLSEFIHAQCGIKMPPAKKAMLEARLLKRLRSLGIATFREYCDYLFKSPYGNNELVCMIDSVATNKTDFFREPDHFAVLAETLLPRFVESGGARNGVPYTVWSAGCSTGEEPYTLTMVLSEFGVQHPGFRFAVLATDISTKALEKAKLGIYEEERTAPVSAVLKKKYLMQSKDRKKRQMRIVPELRSRIQFQRVNLMDDTLPLMDAVDTIFCRNVIIYFEREDQEKLLGRMCGLLKPGGHLFLGHSETALGFDLPLAHVMKTVYRKEI